MAFPTGYEASNGKEFGLSGSTKFIGLNQYKYWIKRCAESGVNVIRIWLGHSYFTPDIEIAGEVRYEQYSKLDELIDFAEKHGVYLKLTIE